jgi:hypothetical protein
MDVILLGETIEVDRVDVEASRTEETGSVISSCHRIDFFQSFFKHQ